MYCHVLCFRSSQTLAFQSPARITASSLSVSLLTTPLPPHPHPKPPTSWMRVSWSARSVEPLIPPVVTGSCWLTLTTALPSTSESELSDSQPGCQDLRSPSEVKSHKPTRLRITLQDRLIHSGNLAPLYFYLGENKTMSRQF